MSQFELMYASLSYLETISQKPIVKKSVSDHKLDHDDQEIKELTENETTKVDVVSKISMIIGVQ